MKRVTSTDDGDVEDPDNDNPDGGNTPSGGGSQTKPKYQINVVTPNTDYGTVSGGGEYEQCVSATIVASPKSGY